MKKLLVLMIVSPILASCMAAAPFAMAVDDENIYYTECLNVLNIWHKCEVRAKKTASKPTMQRVQTVISGDKLE